MHRSGSSMEIIQPETGRRYEIAVKGSAIRAADLSMGGVGVGPGLLIYDPGLTHTAICYSGITELDAESGGLRYRGYAVEDLARRGNYLDVAFLLRRGHLPSRSEADTWARIIEDHRSPPEVLQRLVGSFPRGACPMAILVSALAGLSALDFGDGAAAGVEGRTARVSRLFGLLPALAAAAYGRSRGVERRAVSREQVPGYAANLLGAMLDASGEARPSHPAVERALDALLIVHADHEQNCSTTIMRGAGSSGTDMYLCVSAAAAALSGPLHGGAAPHVVRLFRAIGSTRNIPEYIRRIKAGKADLCGLGHRVHKRADPRAKVIRDIAHELAVVTGRSAILEIALEFERRIAKDEFFASRGLFPNVEFYSGVAYDAMGFAAESIPLFFAIARAAGWVAHWEEMLVDPEQRMIRPRQIYNGPRPRNLVASNQND
jgi:citrate synthase